MKLISIIFVFVLTLTSSELPATSYQIDRFPSHFLVSSQSRGVQDLSKSTGNKSIGNKSIGNKSIGNKSTAKLTPTLRLAMITVDPLTSPKNNGGTLFNDLQRNVVFRENSDLALAFSTNHSHDGRPETLALNEQANQSGAPQGQIPMNSSIPTNEEPERSKTNISDDERSRTSPVILGGDLENENSNGGLDETAISDSDEWESLVLPLLGDAFDVEKASKSVNNYPQGSTIAAELDESYDEETAADDSDAQSFLSDDASEIRAERPKGFILSLGAARPWQWATLSYANNDNSFSLGAGKNTADVIAKSNVINLNLSHYAAGFERRWFPVDEVPFGIFYGLSLGQWQGTTRRGREEGKSYSATGLSSFFGLGLHIQRKSGLFWGVNILGLYQTFVISQSGNTLGGDVRRYIEDQRALGLPNISVGWFLP